MQKQEQLIYNLLLTHSEINGQKVALVDGERKVTYRKLLDSVTRLGCALIGKGIKPGDRIATLAPPCIEFWLCFLACTAIGAQWFGLNPRYKKREFSIFIEDAKPSLIFTFSPFDGRNYFREMELVVREANLEQSCKVVEFASTSSDFESFINCLEECSVPASRAIFFTATDQVKETDTAAIVYTSGTTGRPKGAMLSHAAMRRSAEASVAWMGEALEKVIMAFPINHIGSLNAIGMNTLTYGGTIYFIKRFDIGGILELGQEEDISFAGHNQTTLRMMLDYPGFSLDHLSALKLLIHGGSRTDADTLKTFLSLETKISSVYAQTETCGYVLRSDFCAALDVMANTLGKPIDGVTARIRAPDGYNDLSDGEVGELQLQFDWPFSGYLGNSSATKNVFTDDHFLRTGDLCIRRKDGNYEFIERVNNTFKSGGYTVYPTEIENVILEHPGTGLAAVIPVDDKKFGKVGFAFVSPQKGTRLDRIELLEFLKNELANYKVPKELSIVESLPTLANTKIDRQLLKEIANGNT